MGADFATGFLFGSNLGGFDEDMIYECVKYEERSEMIFANADTELKKGLHKGDKITFLSGIDDMVRYVYDLMTENENGQKTCPVLSEDQDKVNQVMAIKRDLEHWQTSFYVEDNKLKFNEEDVSEDV